MALTETLKKLITFKTVSGNHDEARRQFEWIKSELKGLPIHVREIEHNKFQSMVITTQPDTKNPKVWLAAHLDVVDGSADVWEPREENGKIKGRGAFDMKFAGACYIELLKELDKDLPSYDFGVMFTTDEEIGGFNGIKKLLDEDGYRGDVVLLPDGGNVWQLEEAAKGIWRFDVSTNGAAAHAAYPWQGESATHPLIRFLSEFCDLGDSFITDDTDHWHLTYTVSIMNGGLSANQVAASAQAVIDVRYPDSRDRKKLETGMSELLKKYSTVSIQTTWEHEPTGLKKDHKAVQVFQRMVREHVGVECGWARNHGQSDARHFMPYDIPVLLVWPSAGGAHSEDEWIDTVDLHRFYDVTKAWMQEVSKVEVLSDENGKNRGLQRTFVPSPVMAVGNFVAQFVKIGAKLPKKALARIRVRN